MSGLVAAGLAAPAWLLRDEAPRWRPGGSAAWPMARLAPLGKLPLPLPPGAGIICQGDSNTRGNRVSPGTAWPDRLAARLGPAHAVSNHGRGGAVAGDASPVAVRPGDVVILCFGSNDAAPRGWLRPRRPVSPDRFVARLAKLAGAYRGAGAAVLVMAPPPPGSEAMARRIAPYRHAARRAAAAAGVAFADPAEALDGLSVPLQADALHLNEAAHAALAAWLADLIVPTGDQAL